MTKKTYNTKPSLKCRKSVEKLAEKHCSLKEAMIESGYSEVTASKPKNLTETKGFKQVLAEVGLTESYILKKLKQEIDEQDELNVKDRNRVPALNLASKIAGLQNESGNNLNIQVNNVIKLPKREFD